MWQSAGEGSGDLLWQDGGTESLEQMRFDWRKQIVLVENTMEQEKHTLKEQEYGFWKDFLSLVKVKNSVWFNMLRKVLSQKSRFIPPVKFPSKCRHRFNKMLRKCAKS